MKNTEHYIMFFESNNNFIAKVKYKINVKTTDVYIVNKHRIKRSDENITYKTGEISAGDKRKN